MSGYIYSVYPLEAAHEGYENYSSIKDFIKKLDAIRFAREKGHCCIYKILIIRNVLEKSELISKYE